jgi:riboflavin synthase
MFTGLVEFRGQVTQIQSQPPGMRLVIDAPVIAQHASVGDSVAVNGCCLTVVAIDERTVAFDAGEETLSRTNLGRLTAGSPVNLERSLRVGDQLGGHYVTGHVDCQGALDQRLDDPPWAKLYFRAPQSALRQMASKGSVAIDGVSLTLVEVQDERFSVALIPHTLEVTTLGNLQPGDPVNLETDVLAKYVEKQLIHLRDENRKQSFPFAN